MNGNMELAWKLFTDVTSININCSGSVVAFCLLILIVWHCVKKKKRKKKK